MLCVKVKNAIKTTNESLKLVTKSCKFDKMALKC